MLLYPHQQEDVVEINRNWNSGDKNVLLVKPTGGGKTVVLGSIVRDHVGASCSIAHRQELVGQISMALAREQVWHRIIAPKAVREIINRQQLKELKQQWTDPAASAGVAGVDTIVRRTQELRDWSESVTLWVQDEAHHVLKGNKWGRAAQMFPNAKGLGLTATPVRADGKGLGRHHDGVFDSMVSGVDMRWLIDNKYLTNYKIYAPGSDMNMASRKVAKDGDWSRHGLKAASQASTIVGCVVEHYLRLVPGKCGVVFATDVETAFTMAANFRTAGVTCEAISGDTDVRERVAILDRFRSGVTKVLVNVDIFGEGFDLPAIEFISMARPTMSYSLYAQQFGRALRLLEGKDIAIIIDHVGNVQRHHGPPDIPRKWSLDRRDKKAAKERDPDLIPTRICSECTALYEALHNACPYCGNEHVPAGRSLPEQVEGDLVELDAAALAVMYGNVRKINEDPSALKSRMTYAGAPGVVVSSAVKNHRLRQEMHGNLGDVIAMWAGHQRADGKSDSESYKRFYWRYGVDVLSAQALNRKDAEELTLRIAKDLFDKVGI